MPGRITGPLMARYLMAMLGGRDPLFGLGSEDAAERGRMGDYVFSQEGEEHIQSQ